MPTPTYIALANITLGSAASGVTFSSIPATYRDLVLVVSSRITTGGTYSQVRVNGDSGSNYFNVGIRGNGSTASAGNDASNTAFFSSYNISDSTSEFLITTTHFLDYSATDKHKTMLTRGSLAGTGTSANAHRWSNTAAITSILYATNSSTFQAGSSFALYGIVA